MKALRTLIKNSIVIWKTPLEANSMPTAQVRIQCGIPRLCSVPTPVLHRTEPPQPEVQTPVPNWSSVTSSPWMTSAKNKRDLDSLIHLSRIYSKNIGMSFWRNAAKVFCKRGNVIKTHGVELPHVNFKTWNLTLKL